MCDLGCRGVGALAFGWVATATAFAAISITTTALSARARGLLAVLRQFGLDAVCSGAVVADGLCGAVSRLIGRTPFVAAATALAAGTFATFTTLAALTARRVAGAFNAFDRHVLVYCGCRQASHVLLLACLVALTIPLTATATTATACTTFVAASLRPTLAAATFGGATIAALSARASATTGGFSRAFA